MIRNLSLSATILLLSIWIFSCKKKVTEEGSPVTFKTISMKEEHHLNDKAKNPILSIELKYQCPTAFTNEKILEKIKKIMLADFLPDVADTSGQPEAAMSSYIKGKIKSYESAGEIIMDEDSPDNGDQPKVAWKDNTNLLIRYNSNRLLSYTIESSQYSGGAHGGTTFRNSIVDLRSGEKIGEEDLFTEAAIPLINDIILKKLEAQNQVKTPEELEQIGYFDVAQIEQYKNFYLTKDGLVYTFNQYEIGAYALGTIEVTLTFPDLASFISPGSPLEQLMP